MTLAPGFRARSVSVSASPIVNPGFGQQALDEACRSIATGGAAWADAHLCAWAEVFRKFGAKPQRTPCSAEALRKRVLKEGRLPSIDPVVDLYNAVSLRYAIPVGGENFAAYVGIPRLAIADGTEGFDTIKDGAPALEAPERGEVVWRDDVGVTCRRWNWRQGVRTRLAADAKQMWFVLESLPEMPITALQEAGDALVDGLRRLMPDSAIEARLIGLVTQ
ncbi:B3/4 domain-containing protein [Caballeronia sp. ATUFL_F1_KS4A]|uniref:B3/B4 domain-containing protein n=1 Tax=Caballeronia sp. ATUFL_F1_KS4A TaxID=2921768 RepID=UPI0020288835